MPTYLEGNFKSSKDNNIYGYIVLKKTKENQYGMFCFQGNAYNDIQLFKINSKGECVDRHNDKLNLSFGINSITKKPFYKLPKDEGEYNLSVFTDNIKMIMANHIFNHTFKK